MSRSAARQQVVESANVMRVRRSRRRSRGHPSTLTGIRFPDEQIEAMDTAGESRTDGAVRLIDVANDAQAELGDDWLAVIAKAERDDVTEGQALGRLAKLGAEVEKEREKKGRK